MINKFETSFIVMPSHCNYLAPMIFGGALFSELDLAAASCVNEALYSSECDSAVTYKILESTFLAAAQCGDLVIIKAEITELREKAITIKVDAWRQPRSKAFQCDGYRDQIKIAEFGFVFLTRLNGAFHAHGLKLE